MDELIDELEYEKKFLEEERKECEIALALAAAELNTMESRVNHLRTYPERINFEN